ncbi:MAG: 50S ribosomal protein L25 [Candidatus Saccharimonadales bacterium]
MSTDTITLELDERKITGKAVKHLRKDGILPAVIHDHGQPSIVVQGDYQIIVKAYKDVGKHRTVQLKAGGKDYTALIKKVTFDPRRNLMTHVVFGAVDANEKTDAEVPVRPVYAEGNDSSPAERAGLIVLEQLTTVEIEALPKDLPDELTYDAEKLVDVGDQITVADLRVPAGVTVTTEPEHTLATVFEPSALQAANDDVGGEAEPDEVAETEAEHGDAANDVPGQNAEVRPGGKEQKESKDQGRNPEKQ